MKLFKKMFRKKARVYILPTRMGGYLNGLIFLMFLLSTGYSNNLLLIFTIVLFALNLLWLIQTHFHLHKLKLDGVLVLNGHVDDPIPVKIRWAEVPEGPWKWKLILENENDQYPLDIISSEKRKVESIMNSGKRGVCNWSYLRVETERPFGLYRAWIFWPVKSSSFVYPKLISKAPFTLTGIDTEGDVSMDTKGHEDFRGLSPYQEGESRKISWKHYARSGELLEKEGEELKVPALDLILNLPKDGKIKEKYLSRLATQMVECQKRQIPFSLQSPGASHPSGTHLSHLHDCLKVLAQC